MHLVGEVATLFLVPVALQALAPVQGAHAICAARMCRSISADLGYLAISIPITLARTGQFLDRYKIRQHELLHRSLNHLKPHVIHSQT